MAKKVVFGIESSCDETAIAVVSENKVLYKDLYSSAKEHAKYGGVIPELASRKHEEHFSIMLKKFLKKFDYKQITHIAYTAKPGLIGGLHTAAIFAKTLAWTWNVPLLPIDHRYGHIFSAQIPQKDIQYPFLALVVSGKTTSLYKVKNPLDIEELCHTLDDAAGECLDKIARYENIAYPGGKVIDENFNINDTVVKMINHSSIYENWSFSGFKTSVINIINKNKKTQQYTKNQILSSAFWWVINELVRKVKHYVQTTNINTLYIGGGVSASVTLRNVLLKQKWLKNLYLTQRAYTGDNAVMIAYYAQKQLEFTDKKE